MTNEIPEEDFDDGDDYLDEDYDDYDDERQGRTRIILAAILVLLVLLLAGLGFFVVRLLVPNAGGEGSTAPPSGVEWVRSIYGYGPTEAEQFFKPMDAAIAPDGTIWGVDGQRARLLGFNPDGSYRRAIVTGAASSDPGKLKLPEGFAFDEQGNMYVTDGANAKVLMFDSAGDFVREISVPYPIEVAARNGRIVVGSTPGFSVFDDTGKLLVVVGKRGSGPDDFEAAHGIAIADDGTVYVSDANNARIKAYGLDGKLKWVWPADRLNAKRPGAAPGGNSGPLQIPMGLTIDGQGRIVLVDAFHFAIIVLEPGPKGAKEVARYGEPGTADGYFGYPSGIDYDPVRDYFVVADTANSRLQVVRIPGSAAPGLIPATRRMFANPWAWCCLPLILLLIAAAILAARRRRQREDEDRSEDSDEDVSTSEPSIGNPDDQRSGSAVGFRPGADKE